jgi:phosphoesterase RecJ-like protein
MNVREEFKNLVDKHQKFLVIQAENPDGDSLGSALALEEILGDLDKSVYLYCPVIIPTYLRFIEGWDRVYDVFPSEFDVAIIVDTSAATLIEKVLVPENVAVLNKKPVVLLDHHGHDSDMPFATIDVFSDQAVATGELIFSLAKEFDWSINSPAAEKLAMSILFDSLGLTTEATTSTSVRTIAELIDLGANLSKIDNSRRQLMKKSPEILSYKADLIKRLEYMLDDRLVMVTIPWEEIEQYSDEYNPSMLVIEEMRMTKKAMVAVAFKTYPDGKITAKLRANPEAPIAKDIAMNFGGGGHPQAAGFKVRGANFNEVKQELVELCRKLLDEKND